MKDEILIICREQFGYHTDIYKWCQYLRDEYTVSVITFGGKPKVCMEDVRVHYVSLIGARVFRGIRFIIKTLLLAAAHRGPVLVCYFPGCCIYKLLLPWKKIILDIRTLDVSADIDQRSYADRRLSRSLKYFDHISVISEGVAKKLRLNTKNYSLLPLGAEKIECCKKDYSRFRLIYIGTLFNRDIHKTVEGLALFLRKHPETDIFYDIIGDGPNNEAENLKSVVIEHGLEGHVKVHGYLLHSDLMPFLREANVGVSFVPMTDYYEHQPVTKSYEYILAGLYTIATNTGSNRKIISKTNGILINDSPLDFAHGLEKVVCNAGLISTEAVQQSLKNYTWQAIIENNLKPIIKSLY